MPPEIMSQSCGCTIAYAVDTNGERDNRIVYCPTHAHAHAMWLMLRLFARQVFSDHAPRISLDVARSYRDEARALLKEIDG